VATERATATAGVSAWLVRALLLVAAGLFLWWGQGQASVLRADLLAPTTSETTLAAGIDPEATRFWSSIVLFALAGLGFGLATRFPFPRPRFAIGRLLLAFVGLVPALHFWFYRRGQGPREGGLLGQGYWFDDLAVIVVGAALAGVAIASGVGARRGRG
jgi:hypothetical protein